MLNVGVGVIGMGEDVDDGDDFGKGGNAEIKM
jgi:hypothetical protein